MLGIVSDLNREDALYCLSGILFKTGGNKQCGRRPDVVVLLTALNYCLGGSVMFTVSQQPALGSVSLLCYACQREYPVSGFVATDGWV